MSFSLWLQVEAPQGGNDDPVLGNGRKGSIRGPPTQQQDTLTPRLDKKALVDNESQFVRLKAQIIEMGKPL